MVFLNDCFLIGLSAGGEQRGRAGWKEEMKEGGMKAVAKLSAKVLVGDR